MGISINLRNVHGRQTDTTVIDKLITSEMPMVAKCNLKNVHGGGIVLTWVQYDEKSNNQEIFYFTIILTNLTSCDLMIIVLNMGSSPSYIIEEAASMRGTKLCYIRILASRPARWATSFKNLSL